MKYEQIRILFTVGVLTAIAWISIEVREYITAFFDDNIWARWAMVYVFSLGSGVTAAYCGDRIRDRYKIPIFTTWSIAAFVFFIFLWFIVFIQISFLSDYYVWMSIVTIGIFASNIVIMFSSFMLFWYKFSH
jgi:hypothetical protein